MVMFDRHSYVTFLGMALRAHSHHPLHVLEDLLGYESCAPAIQPAVAQKNRTAGGGVTYKPRKLKSPKKSFFLSVKLSPRVCNAPYLCSIEHPWRPRPMQTTRHFSTTHGHSGEVGACCGEGVRGGPIWFTKKGCKAKKAGHGSLQGDIDTQNRELDVDFVCPHNRHAA